MAPGVREKGGEHARDSSDFLALGSLTQDLCPSTKAQYCPKALSYSLLQPGSHHTDSAWPSLYVCLPPASLPSPAPRAPACICVHFYLNKLVW